MTTPKRGEVLVQASLVEQDDGAVLIRCEVRDTGIGISTEAQGRLFRSFSQADGSTTRKFGGTGLGLAISKQLVELMGGQIGIESTPGQGSTFWFTVRLERAPARVEQNPVEAGRLHGRRFLIVDDNATNRTILERQLASWGVVYASAADGPSALEQLRDAASQPFDLVLLDFQMPGMDGLALARAITADAALGHPRLVLLTSSPTPGLADELGKANIVATLNKPIRQVQLYDCLVRVLTPAEHLAPWAAPGPPKSVIMHGAPIAQRARLLVVEDNIVNQRVAVHLLDRLGYRADVAANGREAVEALASVHYAAVLMDCQMPVLDGFEATGEIRAGEGSGKHLPIIAMTAAAMLGERERCLAAGMDDYLSKPVRRDELAALLARWIPGPSVVSAELCAERRSVDRTSHRGAD